MASISSKVHLGKIIQEKVNKSGLTITEFAQKINLSRPAVYQMFNKQSIDTDLLVRISLLLKENLCKIIYCEVENVLVKEQEEVENILVKEQQNVYQVSTGINENEKERISINEENYLNLMNKIEIIHMDLLSIRNILQEMKALQEMK